MTNKINTFLDNEVLLRASGQDFTLQELMEL